MDIQRVFSLSESLIDKTHLNFEEIYYYIPPQFSDNLGNSVLYSAMWTLDAYYNLQEKDLKFNVGFQNYVSIREMIKNSRWHGGSKDDNPTFFGLFIHPEKFILGCYDGGEYFKKQETKEIWEGKSDLKEYHNAHQYGIGYHFGYRYFKDKFNEIKIDSEQGVFYGIVNTEKLFKKTPK